MTTTKMTADGFPGVVTAGGRSSEIPEALDCYGWLAGSCSSRCELLGRARARPEGEAHFAGCWGPGRPGRGSFVATPYRRDRPCAPQGTTRASGTRRSGLACHLDRPPDGARVDLVGAGTEGRRTGRDVPNGAPIRWIFRDHAGPSADGRRHRRRHTWKRRASSCSVDWTATIGPVAPSAPPDDGAAKRLK